MSVSADAATGLLVSGFVLLDGFLGVKLYRGEPSNPNFRPGFAIHRFRGKWELRIGFVLGTVSATTLVVAALIN